MTPHTVTFAENVAALRLSQPLRRVQKPGTAWRGPLTKDRGSFEALPLRDLRPLSLPSGGSAPL